jgi:hypothetical protein
MSGRPFECPLPYFSEKPFTTIKDRGLFTFGNLATPVTTCCLLIFIEELDGV